MPAPKATLKPYLEEIRQWVAQGRTDIWIAHALNSTPATISAFRSANGILRRELASECRRRRCAAAGYSARRPARGAAAKPRRRSRAKKTPGRSACSRTAAGPQTTPRRASRRADGDGRDRPGSGVGAGGRGRDSKRAGFEAVLDTGDEGYGFWLDGAVRDDPVFAENWADRRAILVRIEADQIVIRPDDR